MKRIFALVMSVVAFSCLPFSFAHAQFDKSLDTLNSAVGPKAKVKTGLSDDLTGTIGTVVRAILALTGTIFLLLTIYAGILWMTAQGEEEKITKSKSIIKACIFGLIITLSAYSITYFVASRVGKAAAPTGTTATK